MSLSRIAITGAGVVSPLGVGLEETWAALLDARQGVKTISVFSPGKFPCQIAGQLEDFSAKNFVPKSYRKAVKVMARDIEIAVAAADLAFRQSGINTRGVVDNEADVNIERKRLGCNIGAGLICTELDELGHAICSSVTDGKFDQKVWGAHGMENLTPLWLLKYLPNMLSCHVTIIHGAEGPSNNITCGDAAAHLSIGESALYIKRGTVDAVITGAAESKLNPMGLLRQGKLGRLSLENDNPAGAVRPFDATANGTVIGEGGGLLVLECMDRAKGRNAPILAELVGFGAACDPLAIDVLRPTVGNLDLAVENALADAGITADDVDAIFAYGTGVPGEDVLEAAAWKNIFGDRLSEVPACSFTGATGSMFAGSGGVQLALAAKAISEQTLPPTVNFTTPAEGCELNLSAESRKLEMNYILAGAYTVGGQSGVCVLKKVSD